MQLNTNGGQSVAPFSRQLMNGAQSSLRIAQNPQQSISLSTRYQSHSVNPPAPLQHAQNAFQTISHNIGIHSAQKDGVVGGVPGSNTGAQTLQVHPATITPLGFDPCDRSTTAGTTLPHLQTTKNSFKFVRHRGSGAAMNITGNQAQHVAQHSLANDLSGGIIQVNCGIPTLAQVQTIGNMTQQKMKLRTIPRRTTYKIAHFSSRRPEVGSQHASNSSATDDELHHQSQSRQNKAFMQVSGEKLSIGGSASGTNNAGALARNSPIAILKSDPKPQQVNSNQQPPSVIAQGNSILDRLSQNYIPPGVTSVTGRMHIQQEDRNGSPVLLPLPKRQYISAACFAQTADISPSQSASNNNGHVFNPMNPSSFYPGQPQAASDNFEGVASSLVVAQQVNRDIKIRKLNPSGSALGKANLRLQQAQNAGLPSPITITSLSSQGLLSQPAQQAQNKQTAIQKNVMEVGFSTESNKSKRKLEEQYRTGGIQTSDSPKGFLATSLLSQNVIIGSNVFTRRHGDEKMGFSGEKQNESRLGAPRGVPGEKKVRKFTSHTKFTSTPQRIPLGQQQSSLEIRQLSNYKQGQAVSSGFASIPNFIPQSLTSMQSLSHTFVPNKKHSNEANTNATAQSLIDGGMADDLSQNNSTVLHLESYDQLQSPDLTGTKGNSINFGKTADEHSLMDEVLVGSREVRDSSQFHIRALHMHRQEELEIGGAYQEIVRPEKSPPSITQPYIEDQSNYVHPRNVEPFQDLSEFNESPTSNQQNFQDDEDELQARMQQNQSPRGQTSGPQSHLPVIEEENHDETNKSQQSRKQDGSLVQSHSTLSSGAKNPLSNQKIYEVTMQQSYGANLNNSLDQGGEVYSKFVFLKKTNEEFRRLICKIQSEFSQLDTTLVQSEEIRPSIERLATLSSEGVNELSADDIRRCLLTKIKIDKRREWFQKKKLEREAQESSGILSRSNDQINFSKSVNKDGTLMVTQSAIEENIVVTNNLSNSMMSLTNSLSHAPVGGFKFGPGIESLYDRAVAARRAQGYAGPQWLPGGGGSDAVKSPDTSTYGDGNQQKAFKQRSPGARVDSSGSDGHFQLSKKNSSQESQSQSANSKAGKNFNDIKREQYSQRHQSNQLKLLSALQQGITVTNAKAGSGANQSSSNSLVNNGLSASKGHKVKSCQQQNTSHDGVSSHKSDPNQNRLNKLSSGSDSYYIPQSGESFHYQPVHRHHTHRQSKSLMRQGTVQPPSVLQGPINSLLDPNASRSGSGGDKAFNEVMTGQKAIFGDRILAPVQEKVQGSLIKWREIKKLGQGTSGEVFLVQNILKNAQPQFFVVKKLQIISLNSGIDKDAVAKLRKEIEVYKKLGHENIVKYIGSEVVATHFCIYLEYMSGGTIQANYLSHPLNRLPEKTLKLYTKQILVGLAFLHENRVIHGDLKCANLLVDDSRKIVKLTDFGSAKLVESSISQSDLNCVIRGSLAWMAPEVLNNKGIRRKADVWSLGCCVIEMAIGGNPWGNLFNQQNKTQPNSTTQQQQREIMNLDNNYQALLYIMDPNNSPQIPAYLSEECQDFVKRCLTREYDQRPTASELLLHPWITMEDKKKQ